MKRDIFTRIVKDESGATAIEYGLIVALVSVAAMTTLGLLGGQVNAIFDSVKTKMTPAG